MSSVTMVLAVDAGHETARKDKGDLVYVFKLSSVGAYIVGSQACGMATFIKGDYGALETKGVGVLQFVSADSDQNVCNTRFAENHSR